MHTVYRVKHLWVCEICGPVGTLWEAIVHAVRNQQVVK